MTTVYRWVRTFVITGAIALVATVASPQSVHHGESTAPKDHSRRQAAQTFEGDHSMAAMLKVGMTRMGTADAELEALVADMNLFTGEMKIETMARVLTLLVERQSMMRGHMMAMHERMMQTMMGATSAATEASPPDAMTTDDLEPDVMCVETPD